VSLVVILRDSLRRGEQEQRSDMIRVLRSLHGEGRRALEEEISRTREPALRERLESVLSELE
jgi:hypothetical protein